jgi:hypothetical protein
MAVTELALLTITSPSLTPSTLGPLLDEAKSTLEKASGHRFAFYGSSSYAAADAQLLIVGSWEDISAHSVFLKSPENLKLLSMLENKVEVNWMIHLNTDMSRMEGYYEKEWVRVVATDTKTLGNTARTDIFRGQVMEHDTLSERGYTLLWGSNKSEVDNMNECGQTVGVFGRVILF